ncbi:MAG: hypothetical protein HZY73_07595 [Micropruina sp.]|nr:MAG: hypothetical protein HZY73_07595 [Micropruina sp.]
MERAELAGDGLCVAAVVVAYNSTVAVERCLHSLAAQTVPVGAVLLIDNSEPTPLSFDLPAGLGSESASLWRARTWGRQGFCPWLGSLRGGREPDARVVDGRRRLPGPRLLGAPVGRGVRIARGVALFPSAVYEKTGQVMNFPGWSGVLLDRIAVRLAGLPLPELFWWAEDTEYLQFRLPRKGCRSDEWTGPGWCTT